MKVYQTYPVTELKVSSYLTSAELAVQDLMATVWRSDRTAPLEAESALSPECEEGRWSLWDGRRPVHIYRLRQETIM